MRDCPDRGRGNPLRRLRERRRDGSAQPPTPTARRPALMPGPRLGGPSDRRATATDPDGLIDLVAVRADEDLINMLGAGRIDAPSDDRIGERDEDLLVAMLIAWKASVDTGPGTPPSDTTTVAVTVAASRPSPALSRRPPRPRRLFVGAAAVLVAALAGVSLGAQTAFPGDPLWAVSTVLYSQRAASLEAVATLRTTLGQAQAALAAGHPAQAAQQLDAAAALLAVVRPEDGAAQLAQQQQSLAAQLPATPPATDPGAATSTPQPGPTQVQTPPDSPAPPSPPGTDTRATAPPSADPRAVLGAPVPTSTTPPSTTPPSTTPAPATGTPTSEGTADPSMRPVPST